MLGPGIMRQVHAPCQECHGVGQKVNDGDKCKTCIGRKVVRGRKSFPIAIPPGMGNNQGIIMRRVGNQAPGKVPGDIQIVIREKPHAHFRKDKFDLHLDKKITLLEALSGFQFTITMLDGKKLNIRSESVIQPGMTKRIINHGMPHHNNPGIKGCLIIKFHIEFPKERITAAEELAEQLGQERKHRSLDVKSSIKNVEVV